MSHLFPGIPLIAHGRGGIVCTATGTTLLGAPKKRLVGTHLMLWLSAVSGFTTEPTISVGTNAPNYDNLLNALSIIGLFTLNDMYPLNLGGPIPSVASGADLRVNVSVAAVSTTYTLGVYLIGFQV